MWCRRTPRGDEVLDGSPEAPPSDLAASIARLNRRRDWRQRARERPRVESGDAASTMKCRLERGVRQDAGEPCANARR